MINTLARHLAALSEARRLVQMVLVNNPSFVVWQAIVPGDEAERARLEAVLIKDRNYRAFVHLNEAISLLSPERSGDGPTDTGSLSERIKLIAPSSVDASQGQAGGDEAKPADPAVIDEPAVEINAVSQPLPRDVCEPTNVANAPPVFSVSTSSWNEAQVAIVRRQSSEASRAVASSAVPLDRGDGRGPSGGPLALLNLFGHR